MPRHILVLGSTSPAGTAFCLAALRESHTLTLYVRNASKLPAEVSSNATVIVGDLTSSEALNSALACGAKTCISFLGPVPSAATKGQAPIAAGYASLVPLFEKYAYERVMITSTASYKVAEDRFSFGYALMVWSIYLFIRAAYDEINAFTPIVTRVDAERIKWTVFRVPMLKDGRGKEVKTGFVGDVGMSLDRGALAEWVLKEMVEEKWVGKCPAVSNA
ncbi:hypothetical protein DE146DRAFT_638798 [Phaeosphaeria sp. MPI-PUGE-AT-0046c]|nr:hypothetical protein DE146DRAFT_638798 [Phaeosphaeria sp. MPI-PUGE-AT-0046c]